MSISETAIALTYGLIGSMGALALLVFIWGVGLYLIRIGTDRRITGIRIMEWGVRCIITTFFFIGILHLLEYLT